MMPTLIIKNFVWGQMLHSVKLQTTFLFRSHQVKASPAMSGALLQLEAIQNRMFVSVATCSSPYACLTCQPRQPFLHFLGKRPDVDSVVPKANIF